MAAVTISRDFVNRKDTSTTATMASVAAVLLDYKTDYAVIEIEYLDANDNKLADEMWAIRGAALTLALGQTNTGSTALDGVNSVVEFFIDYAENTAGVKDGLIAAGTLEITRGRIINGIRPFA